jgi:pyroglutamyl-peptidase
VSRLDERVVLVSGFGPFLTHDENPSELLARRLDGTKRVDLRFVACAPLPVAYGIAAELTLRRADELRAVAVLALGLAANTLHVRVERHAHNRRSAVDADTDGVLGGDRPVLTDGPPRLSAEIGAFAVLDVLRAAGLDAEASEDAGGYVCNDLYYHLLHAGRRALFVHLPSDAARWEALPAALADGVAAWLGRP